MTNDTLSSAKGSRSALPCKKAFIILLFPYENN